MLKVFTRDPLHWRYPPYGPLRLSGFILAKHGSVGVLALRAEFTRNFSARLRSGVGPQARGPSDRALGAPREVEIRETTDHSCLRINGGRAWSAFGCTTSLCRSTASAPATAKALMGPSATQVTACMHGSSPRAPSRRCKASPAPPALMTLSRPHGARA